MFVHHAGDMVISKINPKYTKSTNFGYEGLQRKGLQKKREREQEKKTTNDMSFMSCFGVKDVPG